MGFSSTPKDTTFGKIFGLTLSISDLLKASYSQQGYLLRMSRFADLGGLRPPPCQASFRIFTGTQAPQLCQNLSGRSKQSHFLNTHPANPGGCLARDFLEEAGTCVPAVGHLHPTTGINSTSSRKHMLPYRREASTRM